jgi:glutaredoxin
MKQEITVYVRSMKIPVGETLVEELYPIKPRAPRAYEISKDTWFKVKLKKIYRYVLPDDQKALVEAVKQLSERHGLELKIIDVTKETAMHRLWRKLKGIKNFPVVKTNRGDRLQAPFSQSRLERFVSESALPTN